MTVGIPDFQYAQPVTNYQQGMAAGNALQAQQLQLQQPQQSAPSYAHLWGG